MGNYEKRTKQIKGRDLKSIDYRAQLEYKGNWVAHRYIDDEKTYVVHIHELEDSEGWIHTTYQIDDGYPEFEQMIENKKLNDAVAKEIEIREKEYFDKLREKYQNMSHEKLVNEIIVLQQRLKNLFYSSAYYYGC